MQLIVGLLWSWWNARNKANAGEGMRSTDEVIFRVRLLIQKDQKVEAGESRSMQGQMFRDGHHRLMRMPLSPVGPVWFDE